VYVTGRVALTWLTEQSAFRLPFGSIQLEPGPPAWYRGGTVAFLEDVRRRARMPHTLRLLELRDDDLVCAFKKSPWTEAVERRTYPPLGLIVHLRYKVPAALVETSAGTYLVDATGVILPADDLDTEAQALADRHPLIRIKGDGLAAPLDATPGIRWKTRPGVVDAAPENQRIASAAKLARFLLDKMRTIDTTSQPGLDIQYINPMDRRGLFLWNAESTYIFWGEAPGEETTGSLDAEEKWRRLRDWGYSVKDRALPLGNYWKITPIGLVRLPITDEARAGRAGSPDRDPSTIRANGSGR
jgi:hypothetical protein